MLALVTRHSHSQNEEIRNRFGVVNDREKNCKIVGFDGVCPDENSPAKVGLIIEVDGKCPKGRSKQRWLDALDGDLKDSPLHLDQAND